MPFLVILLLIFAVSYAVYRVCYGSHLYSRCSPVHPPLQPGEVAVTTRGVVASGFLVPHDEEIHLTGFKDCSAGRFWSGRWYPENGGDAVLLHGIPENALQHWMG